MSLEQNQAYRERRTLERQARNAQLRAKRVAAQSTPGGFNFTSDVNRLLTTGQAVPDNSRAAYDARQMARAAMMPIMDANAQRRIDQRLARQGQTQGQREAMAAMRAQQGAQQGRLLSAGVITPEQFASSIASARFVPTVAPAQLAPMRGNGEGIARLMDAMMQRTELRPTAPIGLQNSDDLRNARMQAILQAYAPTYRTQSVSTIGDRPPRPRNPNIGKNPYQRYRGGGGGVAGMGSGGGVGGGVGG